MKVLHLPSSVGGNAWGLAQGERAIGLDSRVLVACQSYLQYPADIDLNLQRIPSKVRRFFPLLSTFLQVRKTFDVFHFNCGSSLIDTQRYGFPHAELPLYPSRARLFVTYNGCDARQKYRTMERTPIAACHSAGCYGGQCNSGRLDRQRRQAIEKMSRYVRHIWSVNPDLLHFLPAGKSSFLPYSPVFGEETPQWPRRQGKLLILHAPTDREAKGSGHILAALERLEKSHPGSFEMRLVERLPHREAIKLYREADLVIDQVLIGWYGAFAVEAMRLGKPVIARIAREDLRFVPEAMARQVEETVLNADPASLYEVLVRCVENPALLRRHAEASVEYANLWHDPRYVASLTREEYERR